MRPDLADIRLADRIFAPHYAVAVEYVVVTTADLCLTLNATSEVIGTLTPGDRFELLDVIGGIGWGIAVARGLVGYVSVEMLARSDR